MASVFRQRVRWLGSDSTKEPTGTQRQAVDKNNNKQGRSTLTCSSYKIFAAITAALVLLFALHTLCHKEVNHESRPSSLVSPSRSWLEGKRMGNVDHGLTRLDIESLIAIGARGSIRDIIGESVCATDSPLATLSDVTFQQLLNSSREDTGQLIYRAIHENQYGPAREEARSRLEHWDEWKALANDNRYKQNNNSSTASIGMFDFECPNATFLIAEGFTNDVGLGSSLRRWGNVPVFLLAVLSGRVFHFINPDGTPMMLATCKERNDLQCSFLPMSPCVLTQEDIDKAPVVGLGGLESFLKENPNERVIRSNQSGSKFEKKKAQAPRKMARVAASLAIILTALYAPRYNMTTDEEKSSLFATFQQVLAKQHKNGLTVNDAVDAAAFLFITRPNRAMRYKLDKAIQDSFPIGYESTKAVGLPIRASDKCRSEAICIGFKDYIRQLRSSFPMDDMKYILLTSEDESILKAGKEYKSTDVTADIITNRHEVAQGIGKYSAKKLAGTGASQEEVMTSTMSAWAFQLRTGYSFLNLCSNFHVLIESSIKLGCGMATMIRDQNVTCNLGFGGPIIRNSA